jgi:hypothetical protein
VLNDTSKRDGGENPRKRREKGSGREEKKKVSSKPQENCYQIL